MKKYLYVIVILILISIFIILNPRKPETINAYQETDSYLLLPQRNVVIITLNLNENNLDLNRSNDIHTLRKFNSRLKNIKGVNKVDSLLNATVIASTDDDIEVKKIIPPIIDDDQMHRITKSLDLYPELKPYVNSKGDSLLFYISFGFSTRPNAILNSLKEVTGVSPLIFSYTGKSPIVAITEELLSNDILVFLPILFVIVMVIFLSFRSLKTILAAWVIMLLAVILSYSFITYTGVLITPLILLVPVFGLGLLSDYIIHYVYHLFYSPLKNNSLQVRKGLLFPLGLTALSTLTGFLSLMYIGASGHALLGGIISLAVLFTFLGVILWLPYINLTPPKKELLPRFSHYQIRLFSLLYNRKKYY